tara:strand:- start:13755 stop:15035 length:1281 start_codon:yes stop_codon:yes gene_type:complete
MEPRRTADEIRAQLAAFQGNTTYDPNSPLPGNRTNSAPTVSESSGTQSNALIDALTERLTQQGQGISTSSSSNLQQLISATISETQRAGELSRQRIQSERERELAFARGQAGATITGALEERTGYATQVVAINNLAETTEKSVRDLDKRYQEAIMANDAATAQRVADLQMQKLEFLNQQEQQFYDNLFSLANLQESAASREQQAAQFNRRLTSEEQRFERQLGFDLDMFERQSSRDERNRLLEIAAEYGVNVGPNETIESMIAKVSPFVDERRQLELQSIRADINASNARAAEALSRTRDGEDFDPTHIEAYALAYLQGDTALMVGLEEMGQAGPVLQRVQAIRNESENKMQEIAGRVTSTEEFTEEVSNDPDIYYSAADIERYEQMFLPEWREKNKGNSRTPNELPVFRELQGAGTFVARSLLTN